MLLLLAYMCLALAFFDSQNRIGVRLPSYAEGSGFKMNCLKAALSLGLAVFAVLPLPSLAKFQIISLAVVSFCLLCKHLILDYVVIFNYIPGSGFILTVLFVLLAIVLSFLCLNVKFRRLFGSIGSGYVLTYMIMLIFTIPSLATFIVFFVIAIALLILLGKFDEFKFNCTVRTINIPFLLACFVNDGFYRLFYQMHSVNGYALAVWMGRLFFLLSMAVVFAYVFFQDKITEKVSSMAARNRSGEEAKSGADGSENV